MSSLVADDGNCRELLKLEGGEWNVAVGLVLGSKLLCTERLALPPP